MNNLCFDIKQMKSFHFEVSLQYSVTRQGFVCTKTPLAEFLKVKLEKKRGGEASGTWHRNEGMTDSQGRSTAVCHSLAPTWA